MTVEIRGKKNWTYRVGSRNDNDLSIQIEIICSRLSHSNGGRVLNSRCVLFYVTNITGSVDFRKS